jgi:hypothetical protein
MVGFERDGRSTVEAGLGPPDARGVDGDVEPTVAQARSVRAMLMIVVVPRITIHRHMMPEIGLRAAKQATSQALR